MRMRSIASPSSNKKDVLSWFHNNI
jgi:hypothetical protein